MEASEFESIFGPSTTFAGEAIDSTAVLVKYTYYGDADFNGIVNFDDYVRTDSGFNNHRTGWLNGDFDLNGTVNFDDYVLIDLAFNTQSCTLGRALAFLDGSDHGLGGMSAASLQRVEEHLLQFGDAYAPTFLAAVPEPATMGMMMLILPSLLVSRPALRRRRRHCGNVS